VKVPLYGCDCYAYGLLAAGHVDLVIERGLKVPFLNYTYSTLIFNLGLRPITGYLNQT